MEQALSRKHAHLLDREFEKCYIAYSPNKFYNNNIPLSHFNLSGELNIDWNLRL